MIDWTQIIFGLTTLLILTAGFFLWLWFMVRRPQKWAAWVNQENNFWVRKGLVSAAYAEKSKRLEKGLLMKIIVGIVAGMGTLAIGDICHSLVKIYLSK